MASDQFCSPALAASASVQRLMWWRIESSMNNRQAEGTLSSETLRVAYGVGPGCSLSTLVASKFSGSTPPTLNDSPLCFIIFANINRVNKMPHELNSSCALSLPLPLFPLAVPLRRVLHPACPTFMASMTCCCTLSSNSYPSLHASSASQSLDESLVAQGGS